MTADAMPAQAAHRIASLQKGRLPLCFLHRKRQNWRRG
jgi:hypothetical protein